VSLYHTHACPDRFVVVFKPAHPFKFRRICRNAHGPHFLRQNRQIKTFHAAFGMTDDHDFANAKHVYRDKKASHHASIRMGYHRAGVFDYLCLAVSDIQRRGQKFDKARIHARHDGKFFIGYHGRDIGDVFFRRDEFFVKIYDFINYRHMISFLLIAAPNGALL